MSELKRRKDLFTKQYIRKISKRIFCCILLIIWLVSGCCIDSGNRIFFLGVNISSMALMYLLAKRSGFVFGTDEYIPPEEYYSEPVNEECEKLVNGEYDC